MKVTLAVRCLGCLACASRASRRSGNVRCAAGASPTATSRTPVRTGSNRRSFPRFLGEVRAAFDAVLAAVESLGPVQVLAEKTRIAFQVRMSFAAFYAPPSVVERPPRAGPSDCQLRFRTVQTFSPRNVLHTFRLLGPDEVDAGSAAGWPMAYHVGEQWHPEPPATEARGVSPGRTRGNPWSERSPT